MIWRFTILLSVLLCGCATEKRLGLDHYQWAPEHFEITVKSGGWRFQTLLSGGGEYHEIYERSSFLGADHRESIYATAYPTKPEIGPGSIEVVFRNVTNFLSGVYVLSVTIVERSDNAITWKWSGISKSRLPTTSGIEKIVKGEKGVYRLGYTCRSAILSRKQEQTWVPIIKNAALVQKQANKSLQPLTPVGVVSSAFAVHATGPAWLSWSLGCKTRT